MYVNGELIEENAGTWIDPGTTFFVGGGNPANDFCNGTFDEIQIYDRALSAIEVENVYYNGWP